MQQVRDIKSVLIVRWGSMGDLVLCSAVIEDICRAFPEASVALNVEPPWDQLYQGDQRLTGLEVMRVRRGNRLRSTWQWLKMLRRRKPDLIIDLQCNDRSRLLLSLAVLSGVAPRWRVGTRSGFPYNIATEPYPRNSHALRYLRAPLLALGVPCETSVPVINATPSGQCDDTIREAGGLAEKYAILIPGSSAAGAHKRWGEGRYIRLAELMLASDFSQILVLGGGDEIELCKRVADGIGPAALNLCGKTGLSDIVPLAKGAQAVVSNDTGLAHLCAAADTPLVVICGPTLAERVKPAGLRVCALQVDPDCFRDGSADLCMAQVTPEQVLEALRDLAEQ